MSLAPDVVLRRFLAKHSGFDLRAETKAIPQSVANAVKKFLTLKKSGTPADQMPEDALPPEVLIVWQYVVDKQGQHFEYAAAINHWRNKCAKDGIPLTQPFITGLGGAGSKGEFSTMSGEQVDDWVKATLRSEGMMDEAGQSALRWKLEIGHYKSEIEKFKELVDKHTKGIAEGNRVRQRQEWLEKAVKNLDEQGKELARCEKALDEFMASIQRHTTHRSPTVAFEREFQFMMQQAAIDFDRSDVLKAVEAAVKRFAENIEMPPADDVKTANFLTDVLGKAWKWVSSKWAAFMDWFEGLVKRTSDLNKLLDRANA